MAAVIKDHEEKVKLEIADFPLFPRLAILDPESTRTLPAPIAAATGMDAMTHAIEGYVSAEWNPHGDARALHALRLIRDNLERAVEDTSDEEARGNMLVAASLAITIQLGSVHAMSHPAGAHFGVPHGVANAIHLPHVIRFNARGGSDIANRYRDINELFGVESGGSDDAVGDALADHVSGITSRMGLPTRLSEVGVPESGIPALVEGAMGDGTTLLNPREPARRGLRRALQAGALAAMLARLFGPFFVFAGVMHFVVPRTYEAIVPDYLPAIGELVAGERRCRDRRRPGRDAPADAACRELVERRHADRGVPREPAHGASPGQVQGPGRPDRALRAPAGAAPVHRLGARRRA